MNACRIDWLGRESPTNARRARFSSAAQRLEQKHVIAGDFCLRWLGRNAKGSNASPNGNM